MSAKKWTPENREGLLELFRDGLSLEDACREVGISEKTVKNWITRGRREEGTEYAEFTAAVEDARREHSEKEKPLTEDELMLVASRAARKGSVSAMKLVHEMLRAAKGDSGGDSEGSPFDGLDEPDEPAERRAAKEG